MNRFTVNDMKIIVNDFHQKVSHHLTGGNQSYIINILTKQYQELFDNGETNQFQIGRFQCYFVYQSLVLVKDIKPGIHVAFQDLRKTMRPFKKPLAVFLHLYDNPHGYFRLERIMFDLQ
jgi:hypothetical protein